MALQNFLVSPSGLAERSIANRDVALMNNLVLFGDPVAASLENSTALIKGSDPLEWALLEAGRGSHTLYDNTTYQQLLDWFSAIGSAGPVGAIYGAGAAAAAEAGRRAAAALPKDASGLGIVDYLLKFLSENFLLVVIGLILLGGGLLMIIFDNRETIIKAATTATKAAAL